VHLPVTAEYICQCVDDDWGGENCDIAHSPPTPAVSQQLWQLAQEFGIEQPPVPPVPEHAELIDSDLCDRAPARGEAIGHQRQAKLDTQTDTTDTTDTAAPARPLAASTAEQQQQQEASHSQLQGALAVTERLGVLTGCPYLSSDSLHSMMVNSKVPPRLGSPCTYPLCIQNSDGCECLMYQWHYCMQATLYTIDSFCPKLLGGIAEADSARVLERCQTVVKGSQLDAHLKLSVSPSACLPACLPAFLPACLPPCLPACLPACLPSYAYRCMPAGALHTAVSIVPWGMCLLTGSSHPLCEYVSQSRGLWGCNFQRRPRSR
jgi:hypothetical protein